MHKDREKLYKKVRNNRKKLVIPDNLWYTVNVIKRCLNFGALVQWEHATLAVWRSGVQVPYAPFEKVLIFKAFLFFRHKISCPALSGIRQYQSFHSGRAGLEDLTFLVYLI